MSFVANFMAVRTEQRYGLPGYMPGQVFRWLIEPWTLPDPNPFPRIRLWSHRRAA